MASNQVDDFFNPGISQARNSILDIDDSYTHDWDELAELTQNAVDAIRASEVKEGKILITIDSQKRSIKVTDNGIGISSDDLPKLIKPFSSNKRGNHTSIGEKGVGLTFVMFSGNLFTIKSGDGESCSKAALFDAVSWKSSLDEKPIKVEVETLAETYKGTEVYVEGVQQTNLFDLSFTQLKQVIFTKTAIGNTLKLWGEDKDISVDITYTDINNETFNESSSLCYKLPYDDLPPVAVIDFDEFISYAAESSRTDSDKRSKLKDKAITRKGEFKFDNNRTIKFVACFMPSRKVYDHISIDSGLATESNLSDNEWLEKYGYTLVEGGIFTSVKGMPTGISIEHPATGYSGYWPNIFILFEDPGLKFDIGRKSINGRQAKLLRDHAHTIFNDYAKYVKFITGEPETVKEWEKEEIFEELTHINDLKVQNIHLAKSPKDQEAGVAALFYECIGNGMIKGITPLVSGYKNKYDLYCKLGSKNRVIEFKSHLSNIAKDFSDATKLFNEMDCIVCWDVSEQDMEILNSKLQVSVEPIVSNPLAADDNKVFPHATHKLILSAIANPVYVIDMKKVIGA